MAMCMYTSPTLRAPSGFQEYFSAGMASASAMIFFSASSRERIASALKPLGAALVSGACARAACAASPQRNAKLNATVRILLISLLAAPAALCQSALYQDVAHCPSVSLLLHNPCQSTAQHLPAAPILRPSFRVRGGGRGISMYA